MKIIISFALLCFVHGVFAMQGHKRISPKISAQEFYLEKEVQQDNSAIQQSKTLGSRQFNKKIPTLNAIQE